MGDGPGHAASDSAQRHEQQSLERATPGLEQTKIDLLTLAMIPGLGPRTLTGLLERFGSARAALDAPGDALASVSGVGPKLVHAIGTATNFVDVDGIIRWCQQNDVWILCDDASESSDARDRYPKLLSDLIDAPPILFVRGNMIAADELSVAIVGTRHATSYGLKQARQLAYQLARAGVTVVSGLARGIDGAAHEGALDGGGRSIAVLGGGLGQMYPPEHVGLADAIAADGAVVSEYAPDAKPRGGMFPQRNRLIAALSLATLVVEAPDRSGALITARLAMEQNRGVMALPGPVTSRASRGCNQLIRDGARLVQTVDDILEELGPIGSPVMTQSGHEVRNGAELNLNEVERQVLGAIEATSTPIDQVIETSGLPAQRVIAVISVLEIRRLVRRLSGQYVSRV